MKNTIILLFFIFNSIMLFAQSNAKAYIDTYKSIALQQMIETDVPASITLAQGILESAVGTSVLVTQANNHFGLLCTDGWQGEALYKLKDGQEICYKVYNSSADSYIEHTTKLATNPQFENLFYIEPTNYKRWAKGLEALKYSTIPNYADQLIKIIELYELYKIDAAIDIYRGEINSKVKTGFETPYNSDEDILYINDVKAVIASGKETPLEFAARMKIPLRKVLKYNDILLSQTFQPGQYIFLNKKKSKYTKDLEVHKVKETDNMYLISQQYGIRLKNLLRMNQLKIGEEPRVGEKVYLKAKAPLKPVLRSSRFTPDVTPEIKNEGLNEGLNEEAIETPSVRIITPPTTTIEPTKPVTNRQTPPDNGNIIYIYPDEPNYGDDEIVKEENTITPPPIREIPAKPNSKPVPPNVHVVKKGETLYSISKKYKVTVQRLKDLNGLLSNTIEIDQHIRYQ